MSEPSVPLAQSAEATAEDWTLAALATSSQVVVIERSTLEHLRMLAEKAHNRIAMRETRQIQDTLSHVLSAKR